MSLYYLFPDNLEKRLEHSECHLHHPPTFAYVRSVRGHLMVLHNGFEYHRDSGISEVEKSRWRCSKRKTFKCNARVETRGDIISHQYCMIHNHPPTAIGKYTDATHNRRTLKYVRNNRSFILDNDFFVIN